jgi:hypothetical protein
MADLEQTMRKLKESIRNLSAIQDSTSGGARQLEEEYFEQEGELGGDDASEFHQSFSSARSDTVDSMHSEDERGNGLISVGGSRSGSESLLNAIAREAILAGSLAPARQPEIEVSSLRPRMPRAFSDCAQAPGMLSEFLACFVGGGRGHVGEGGARS